MKRTEKYKDSYQYDDQYQQRNQKVASINNVNRDVKVKKITEEMNLVKSIIIKIGDYDENANRYYNDRDFRREQLLEEENENKNQNVG